MRGAPAPAVVESAAPSAGTPEIDVLKALLSEERRRGDNWRVFSLAQTGQLEKANGRTADSIAIVERCEARDREAVRRSRPKVLGIF